MSHDALARRRHSARARSRDASEGLDQIDESLEETFPASDPPSRTFLTRIGAPGRGSAGLEYRWRPITWSQGRRKSRSTTGSEG
jgi:hypothetical protein